MNAQEEYNFAIETNTNMSKLSFKNFRGFIDFPELEFGGITFLVGKNNSGKSTAIKALLLIIDYLNSDDANNFSFDNGKLGDYANIKSFSRAKNIFSKDDFIILSYQIEDFFIEIILTEKIGSFKSTIKSLTIKNIHIDFSIVFNQCIPSEFNPWGWQVSCKQSLINSLGIAHNLFLKGSLSDGMANIISHFKHIYNYNIKDFHTEEEKQKYDSPLYGNKNSYNTENRTKESINKDMLILKDVIDYFREFPLKIDSLNLIYVGASLPKQTAIFRIADKDNSLAQAATEYMQLGIDQLVKQYRNSKKEIVKDPIANFVLNWIIKEKFEIGDDIEIATIEGEAYTIKVKNNEEWISIADKGMGAMQLLTIIFRLACTLYKTYYSSNRIQTIIVFEEPELNLHPALQSKLADLFHEVHILSKGKIKIIIETHSEYLIRRSQVLVAENKLESKTNQNPFRIYYFNDEGDKKHYKIDYDEDGILKKNFGNGFFDEASSNTLKLLRLKKTKLN